MIVQLIVDGLVGSIEQRSNGPFESYVARVEWGEYRQWDPGMRGYYMNSLPKSFGSIAKAEDWLLDQLEHPSFFLLKHS